MTTIYLTNLAGKRTEVVAVTSGGGANAGKIAALDVNGRWDISMMPIGIGPDTFSGVAHEDLAAGAFVYVRSDGKIANAIASSTGHHAEGFVLSAFSTGATALVYLAGDNVALSALTPDTRYYLSATTPGAATATPVSGQGAGSIDQFLGNALDATTLQFNDTDYIVKAS